jgi:predicted nucleic acid-binding protein
VTLVDSNVLIDVMTDDREWATWSEQQLELAASVGAILINDVIYAEISARFVSSDALDAHLFGYRIDLRPTPRAALFLAGKAYLKYRRAGGLRTGVLPDFFIGAHAAVANIPLLTRDARRYQHYFPTIDLIAPDIVQ